MREWQAARRNTAGDPSGPPGRREAFRDPRWRCAALLASMCLWPSVAAGAQDPLPAEPASPRASDGETVAIGDDEIVVTARYGEALVEPEIELRSEEHTSELQSLMRISYAAFCLKTK